jgi:glyoxylase-like metal-dependent hydrolase (beta-lactamase superfamily II)
MKGLLKTLCATLCLFLLGLCLLVVPASAQFIPGIDLIETEDLGDGLYAYRYGPYRNIFIVTDDGVIATDPLDVKAVGPLREAIAGVTDKPVKYVAYSHSHWDHASGGQLLKDEGADFVAQRECLRNMAETRHPDVVLPDIVFDDSYSIRLGDHSLDMYYFGPSHDDCMTVMIAKPANILFVVDITSAPTGWEMEYNPTMAEGYLYNMVPYMRAVEELAEREGVKTIVSGHLALGFDEQGKMFAQPSTGPIDAVREKREFWEILFAAVAEQMAEGVSADDLPDVLLNSEQFKEDFLDRMHRRNWEEDEMWILLRRVATYTVTGR